MIDVTELTFFLFAKVLTNAKDRQIDQVTPFDGGRDLCRRFAIGQPIRVMRGHKGKGHLRQQLSINGQPAIPFMQNHLIR